MKTAVAAKPDRIVIKEIATMLRGRQLGELPSLIQDALLAGGFSREDIVREPDEIEAAYVLLRDARAGDVVVMPVHQTAAREKIVASLDEMERTKWRAGHALPQINVTTYSISNSLVQQR